MEIALKKSTQNSIYDQDDSEELVDNFDMGSYDTFN